MDNAFKEYVGEARVLGIDYGDKRMASLSPTSAG
jgi:hypothetical protein